MERAEHESQESGGKLSLALIVDSRTREVVWYRVARDEVAENHLDEAAEKFKSHRRPELENDLVDSLWIEDEEYDYRVIPLTERETAQDVLTKRGWMIQHQ